MGLERDVAAALLPGEDEAAASEWLTGTARPPDGPWPGDDAAALEWLVGGPGAAAADPGVDEAEIAPALAALIPAVISAAPAIIGAVQQLTGRPSRPAPPPSPAPPQATRPASRPRPPSPRAVRPSPPSTSATPVPSGGTDVLQQLAALLPRLVDLLARTEGREGLESPEGDGPLPAHSAGEHHGPAPGSTARPSSPEHVVEPLRTPTRSVEREPAQRRSAPAREGAHGTPADSEDAGTGAADGEPAVAGPTGRSPPEPGTTGLPPRSSGRLVPLPAPSEINVGVSPCPTSLLVARFGRPRDLVTRECQAITSPFWEQRMVTAQVGQFRARGHRQAVALFGEAFAALQQTDPELCARTGSSGMLCVRHVRGRPEVLSNHAFGVALDVTLDGHVDIRGDGQVQEDLLTLHDVLSAFGIFWGAGLRPEDAVHFEVGAEVVHRWIDEEVL